MAKKTKKTRILAVDDEPIIGESVAYNLDAPHRKIAVAPNGREALSLASKQKFDVVITDHRMPESGGLELVRALRKRNYKGKIVVLSGHLSPENIGVYEDLEIDEVISKPCIMEELRDVVANLEEDISLGI
jgi:YesN/AraC family two-component response regulator